MRNGLYSIHMRMVDAPGKGAACSCCVTARCSAATATLVCRKLHLRRPRPLEGRTDHRALCLHFRSLRRVRQPDVSIGFPGTYTSDKADSFNTGFVGKRSIAFHPPCAGLRRRKPFVIAGAHRSVRPRHPEAVLLRTSAASRIRGVCAIAVRRTASLRSPVARPGRAPGNESATPPWRSCRGAPRRGSGSSRPSGPASAASCPAPRAARCSIEAEAPRALSPTSAMWSDTICVPEAATVVWLAISLIAPCCWPIVRGDRRCDLVDVVDRPADLPRSRRSPARSRPGSCRSARRCFRSPPPPGWPASSLRSRPRQSRARRRRPAPPRWSRSAPEGWSAGRCR